MMQAVLENWPVKLLSAVIGIILWFYVLGAENPQAMQTLTLPVVCVNIPAGTTPITVTPREVAVRVRGRALRLEQTDFERMRLRADMSGAKVGEQTVPMSVSGLPLGLQVLPGHPSTARVKLDKLIQRKRPVQHLKVGEPSSDFAVQKIVIDPEEVVVTGAASVVARVARVAVVVDVSGLNSNLESEADLEARDLRDVVVNNIQFEPARVTVKVTVKGLNIRTVPVRPILGNPPAGYQVTSVQVSPPVVTLTGGGEALGAVDSVSTGRVDISGLRSRKTYAVLLNVPRGTSVLGVASANVTVSVRAAATGSGSGEAGAEGGEPATDEGAGAGGDAAGTALPPPGETPAGEGGPSDENGEASSGDGGDGGETDAAGTGSGGGDGPSPGTDSDDIVVPVPPDGGEAVN